MKQRQETRSWYFCPATAALFVGIAGCEYPDSHELEVIPEWVQSNATLKLLANDVVMRQIDPYTRNGTLELKTGITLYLETQDAP